MRIERIVYELGIDVRTALLTALGLTLLTALVLFSLSPALVPLAIAAPFVYYLVLDYLYRRKLRRIEEELPRFIHYASTYPVPTLKDFVRLGTRGFGELSDFLKGVYRLIESGVPPERALMGNVDRTGSDELKRVFRSVVAAFKTGVSSDLLRNLSEELYVTQELRMERRGALSLQRYTIALSSALLVPLILGLVADVACSIGEEPEVLSLIPSYLLLLASVSGLYLAWTEGNPKNAPLYILIIAATALTTYTVVGWLY